VTEPFVDMLAVGGRSNSLGRVDQVIALVLDEPSRLDELYDCLFHEDAWRRMRAADALEKVCRQHPEWLAPYVDRFPAELASSSQPSILWHLAQMYRHLTLTAQQKAFAVEWLERVLSTTEADWIVAANAMQTLARFTEDGTVPRHDLVALLRVQQQHRSKAVVRRADKLLTQVEDTSV
jgi:hypothetical protein